MDVTRTQTTVRRVTRVPGKVMAEVGREDSGRARHRTQHGTISIGIGKRRGKWERRVFSQWVLWKLRPPLFPGGCTGSLARLWFIGGPDLFSSNEGSPPPPPPPPLPFLLRGWASKSSIAGCCPCLCVPRHGRSFLHSVQTFII